MYWAGWGSFMEILASPPCRSSTSDVVKAGPSRCECASHRWCGLAPPADGSARAATSNAAAHTYGRWRVAPPGDVAPYFAAYMVALDKKEIAAATYAESISELAPADEFRPARRQEHASARLLKAARVTA